MDLLTLNIAQNIFKKYNSKTMNLVHILGEIIEDYESKERADQFLNDLLRVTFDAVVLYKQNRISPEELSNLRCTFRYICSSTTNAYRYGNMDSASILRISDHVSNFHREFQSVLCGGSNIRHTSSPTQNPLQLKIQDTISYVGSVEFLTFAVLHPRFKEVVFSLVHYLEKSKPS
eukprot:TRINITY_DN16572_c0_g1_i1.p1 TRINITY_DN16572_c0_g1~~TRINITY_DN16572_c0_g1_i1.p1  ORF type:complete len:175 (-),score=33.04 TRINITY_DN16572_c0_g1_i1:216-740(-)